MGKFCPNCGTPIQIDDKFCSGCGQDLSRFRKKLPVPPSPKTFEPAAAAPSTPEKVEKTFPSNVYVPDRGIWQKFFSVKGRLNPMRFVFRLTLAYFVAVFLILIMMLLPLSNATREALFPIIAFSPAVCIIPLAIRRAHDFGRPWWYCFIGAIPIFAGVFELIFQKFWYHDKDGEYHEYRRFNEFGGVFAFFYIIVAGIFALLYFTFRSGDKGENEYGANPVGKNQADIPLEKNPLLAAISRAEESQYSTLIIITCVVGLFWGVPTVIESFNPKVPTAQQTTVATNATVPTPAAPAQNNPAPSVAQVPNSQAEVLAKDLTSENQRDAVNTLLNFHRAITQKNYREAYRQLSYDFQYEMDYDGWAAGFATTISSSVSQISVVSESPTEIVLSYILTAVDNVQGREQTTKFNGTVNLINENGAWKIDYIKNKFL